MQYWNVAVLALSIVIFKRVFFASGIPNSLEPLRFVSLGSRSCPIFGFLISLRNLTRRDFPTGKAEDWSDKSQNLLVFWLQVIPCMLTFFLDTFTNIDQGN